MLVRSILARIEIIDIKDINIAINKILITKKLLKKVTDKFNKNLKV